MSKDKFVEVLKANKIPASLEDGMVSVILVGGTGEDVKKTFFQCKLLAQKFGYNHSIRVRRMEEVHDS